MFHQKLLIIFVIAVSVIEFSTEHQRTENENNKKRNDDSNAKVKAETLAAVRRGDIRGFRGGMNKGGLKDYSNIFNNYSYQRIKEIEDTMNEKMFAIERLMSTKLAVPANKEQPQQYLFNVTILPGTDIIAELSLNLEALKTWDFYSKPLHTICNLPDVEPRIVKYILDKGFDINERSKFNWTPLDLAANHGNLPLIKFLIDNGADPKSTFREDLKEYEGQNYHRFIKIFSPKDFSIRPGSKIHHNPLVSAIIGGKMEIVKYFISLGTDINVENQSSSALFIPVLRGRAEMVEILLKNGCDVNGRDAMGMTALHMAADIANVEIAKLLLKYGANVTAIDYFGWTPLHVAALSSQNIAMVELFLEAGASVDATTDRGFTPLILAEVGRDPSFLNCLGLAIATNFPKKFSCQLKSKMCLHQDNIYIIALLHSKGANVNHQDDALGWSILHWAAANGDEKGVKLLVEKYGAIVRAMSKAKLSPDDIAEYFGRTAIARYL